MFKDDFVKYLFFLCLAILLLYIFQPSFWRAHPGLTKFFNPEYSAPSESPVSPGTSIVPAPSRSGEARIAGISISSTGEKQELRLTAGASSGGVDIGGWRVKTSFAEVTLPSVRIPPGGIFTVSSEPAPLYGGSTQTHYFGRKFLGSSGTIFLYSKSGVLTDKYTY